MLCVVFLLPAIAACGPATANPPVISQRPALMHTGQLAFTSDAAGHRTLHVLEISSGRVRQVTNTPNDEHFPAWSPDAKRLAFGSRNQVFLVNSDGSERTQITRTPGQWEAFTPTWSPDGTQLAVASHGNIFIIPADASAADTTTWTQLTQFDMNRTDAGAYTPAWSPAGDRIAFNVMKAPAEGQNSTTQNTRTEIYTMQTDGSDLQRVTTDATFNASLAWSPDGTRLAFVSTRAGNHDIYVINVDGTNQMQLTNNNAEDTLPAWSPDGQHVAFATNRSGNWDIYATSVDGIEQRPLMQTAANEEYPVWHQ